MVFIGNNAVRIGIMLLVTGTSGMASGQRLRRNRVLPIKPQPFDTKGVVYSTAPGLIRMITEAQQPWLVKIGAKTLVEVHGQTGPDIIRPGFFVRFEAPMVGRRGVQGEISALTVCSLADGYTAGVLRDSEAAKPAEKEPAIAQERGDQPDRSANQGHPALASKPGKPGLDGQRPSSGRFLIAGPVRNYRKRVLTVAAGRAGLIKARIAEGAKVTIDTSVYTIASRGDAIRVRGTYVQPGRVSADKVEIELTLANPATGKRGAGRRGRATTRSRRTRDRRETTEGPGGRGEGQPR